MKRHIMKAVSAFLTAAMISGGVPAPLTLSTIPSIGAVQEAYAADATLLSAITSEAQAKAAAIRDSVTAELPFDAARIRTLTDEIKQCVDAAANETIAKTDALSAELTADLSVWEGIARNGGFMADIGAPDTNAIEIYTAEDLAGIADDMDGSYVLKNDIDLADYNGGVWTPLVREHLWEGQVIFETQFAGTLDGQGYVIRNINLASGDTAIHNGVTAGLFAGLNRATVKNLGFVNASANITMPADEQSGIQSARVGVISGNASASQISNCYVSGEFTLSVVGTTDLSVRIGGLCGEAYDSTFRDCFSSAGLTYDCSVTNTDNVTHGREANIGGVVGELRGASGISRCYNTGAINAIWTDSVYPVRAGGVAGSVSLTAGGELIDFFNAGDINAGGGADAYVGGVFGFVGGAGGGQVVSVAECFNTGRVESADKNNFVGGVAGNVSGSVSRCYNGGFVGFDGEIAFDPSYYSTEYGNAGGIVGRCYAADFCYNKGSVRELGLAGGIAAQVLIGTERPIVIRDCVNDGAVYSGSMSGGIIAFIIDNRTDFDAPVTVVDCYNKGTVDGAANAGGLIGTATLDGDADITNCFNDGVIASARNSAGIIADFFPGAASAASIAYCRNRGNIQRTGGTDNDLDSLLDYTGGIVGICSGNKNTTLSSCYNGGDIEGGNVGGIVGGEFATSIAGEITTVESCFNSGVLGGVNIGGISGSGGKIVSCYNLKSITGDPKFTTTITGIGGMLAEACANIGNISITAPESSYSWSGYLSGINNGSAVRCLNTGDITLIHQEISDKTNWTSASVAGISSGVGGEVSWCRNTGDVKGSYDAAGIAARAYSIENCHNTGNVSVDAYGSEWSDFETAAGGIAARGENVANCLNEGSVNSESGPYTGGIAAVSGAGAAITECVNLASVSVLNGQLGSLGGVVGSAVSSRIAGCYNLGSLSMGAQTYTTGQYQPFVGGIVGHASSGDTENALEIVDCANTVSVANQEGPAGGIAAVISFGGNVASSEEPLPGSVVNCRNAGNVLSPDTPGGIVGAITQDDDTDYWNYSFGHNVNIENCRNSGDVTQTYGSMFGYSANMASAAGGIVGMVSDGGNNHGPESSISDPDIDPSSYATNATVNASIIGCSNTAAISGIANSGGIVGAVLSSLREDQNAYEYDSLNISGCSNNGEVTARGESGHEGVMWLYAGGILGRATANYLEDRNAASAYNVPNIVTLSNCVNNGSITATTDAELSVTDRWLRAYAGGILPYASNSYNINVAGCVNNGEIFGNHAGGILASYSLEISSDNTHSLSQCTNNGAIIGVYSGGIVGYIAGEERSPKTVDQCVNYGRVSLRQTGEGGYAGGIAGRIGLTGNFGYYCTVSDCYNIGDISAVDTASVADGVNRGGVYAGGIAGYCAGQILNCYNACESVTSNAARMSGTYSGGIAGGFEGNDIGIDSFNKIENCAILTPEITAEWDSDYPYTPDEAYSYVVAYGKIVGLSYSRLYDEIYGGTEITETSGSGERETSSFLNPATYTDIGWDFNSVWKIAPDGGLPVLQWQSLNIGPPIPEMKLRVVSVKSPSEGYVIEDAAVTHAKVVALYVSHGIVVQRVNVVVSYGADWALYSDEACTQPIADKTMRDLAVGNNTAYIRVSADGFESVVYEVAMNRESRRWVDVLPYHENVIQYHSDVTGGRRSENVTFTDGMFNTSSTEYNQDLSIVSAALSAAAYRAHEGDEMEFKEEYIARFGRYADYYLYTSLVNLGFEEIETYNYYDTVDHPKYGFNTANNSVAYAFGSKTIQTDEGERKLIAAVIRGTDGAIPSEDWISNANTNVFVNMGKHSGFNIAMEEVYRNLRYYAISNNATAESKYLLTGHSRGGAVANMLAVKMSDNEFGEKDNVYCYTFATPNVENGLPTIWNWLGAHDNIFNICNALDLVPYVPNVLMRAVINIPGGQWGKFGRTYWFGDNNTMLSGVHAMDHYIYQVRVNNPPGLPFNPIGDIGTIIDIIACPVDVEVYDKDGALVGSIVNDTVEKQMEEGGFLFVFDGVKYALQLSEEYQLKMIGTDVGMMAYTNATFNFADYSFTENETFTDVELFAGKTLTRSIVSGEAGAPEIRLFVVDAQGAPAVEVAADGDEVPVAGARAVTNVAIKTPPLKTEYAVGDLLDLSGLTATLTYSDGSVEDAAFADFVAKGLGVAPANGASLTVADAYVRVTHTASGKTASVSISVKPEVTPATKYTVSVKGSYAQSTGAGSYASGETVRIYAGTRDNYDFDGWSSIDVTIADAAGEDASFIMPDKNVTVTANWKSVSGGGNDPGDNDPGDNDPGGNDPGGNDPGGNDPGDNNGRNVNPGGGSPGVGALGGGGGGGGGAPAPVMGDAFITPDKAEFAKDDGKDITIKLTPSGRTLTNLRNGASGANGAVALKRGVDYSASGASVIIKAAYLEGLKVGMYKITFDMNGGADPLLTITVVNTADAQTDVSPATDGADTEREISLTLPGVEPRRRSFEDAPRAHWAYEYIRELAKNAIVDGYPTADGKFTFQPENGITRAEIVKLIVASLALPLEDGFDGSAFADWAAVEDWAKPYVGAAVTAGIVNGSIEAGGLMINASSDITRQEMIAMAVRALGLEESAGEGAASTSDIVDESTADAVPDASADADTDAADADAIAPDQSSPAYTSPAPISDFETADEWARQTLAFALENAMINTDGGLARPLDGATRAEAAMMLYKMLEYKYMLA